MTPSARLRYGAAGLIAVAFVALHLPYRPASLEDVDSINFALGVRHFDVARHQPHPPGYPLFIAAAKVAHLVAKDETAALVLVSVLAGASAVPLLVALYRRMDQTWTAGPWPRAASLLTVTAPLYWVTAARPLSDTAGFVVATGVQAFMLGPASVGRIAVSAFLAAFGMGVRSQVAWLTVPLLVVTVGRLPAALRVPGARVMLLALVAGGLAWLVPLAVLSGGPGAYWHALFSQGAEDLSGVRMLWTTPTPRQALLALYYAFVAPWATVWIAASVLLLAVIGLVRASRSGSALLVLGAAFGPYFVFDVLFQETVTARYALPLLVPVAYLAVRGMSVFGRRAAVGLALVVAVFNAHIGGTTVAAYSRAKAPAFRLLEDMRELAARMQSPPTVAMDRREDFDLRRPLVWLGDATMSFGERLPSPPQHEWLELVKYWNSGRRGPVWFLADPLRTDIDLVQHAAPRRYQWRVPYPVLLGGVRPNEMDWYEIVQPDWYLGPGWSVTPESAGVADFERTGLLHGQIEGWVRRTYLAGGAVMIGGRNFDRTVTPRLAISIDGRTAAEFSVPPGAFLETIAVPALASGEGDYAKIAVATSPPASVGIEQFDVTSGSKERPIFGFGEGWQEAEYNPATGLRWRWLSERGTLRILSQGGPLELHLEGESPRRYFSRPSRLLVERGGTVILDRQLSSDFSIDVKIPPDPNPAGAARNGDGTEIITLATDQTYVPAERSRRTFDRRKLGLRIYRCEVRPAS